MFIDENGQQMQHDDEFLEAVAKHMKYIQGLQRKGLVSDREARRDFRRQLRNRWKLAFNQFDALIVQMRDTAIQFIGQHQAQAQQDEDELFLVLAWLQSRASMTASEIRALLFSGHINGAFARWRTLHETAVVMSFLSKYPAAVEPYRLHQYIHLQKLVENIAAEASLFGYSTEEARQVQEKAKKRRDQLCTKFGKSFKDDYGWATEPLGKNKDTYRTNLIDLEEAVGLHHRRAMFRRSSSNIHAIPSRETFENHALLEDLTLTGLTMLTFDPMPKAIPTEAAWATLKSLLHCLATLLQQRKNGNILVHLEATERLIGENLDTFREIEKLGDGSETPNGK